jgi:hypothetical protein
MTRTVAFVALAGAVTLTACDSIGQAMSSHTDVLARAGGHELTVDDAADMLAAHAHIPAQPEVIDAVANLWVDYILLATAAAQDSTLAGLDLEPLLRPFMEQEVVTKLRDNVIQVSADMSDDELRAMYERDQPSTEVRARHILFRAGMEATPAQRDSIMTRARDVRAQIVAGADFAEMARQHSEDPGSAQQGGDLDYFGRGQMVVPFEEAAFALQAGEVSEVVESPFGLHIIKVEDKRSPPFESVSADYREFAQQQRVGEAEETYVRGLTEPMNIQVQDGAIEVAKELGRKPLTELRGRAANRALVRYQGGSFTAEEFRGVMRSWQPQQRAQLAAAADDQIEMVLQGLTRNKILVNEAHARGFSLTQAEQDSLTQEARQQLRDALQMTGLGNVRPIEGETQSQAIERRVREFMQMILRGEQAVLPLGPLTYSLRAQYSGEVFERAYPTVVSRLEARRPPGGFGDQPMMPPTGQPDFDMPMPDDPQLPPAGGQ